ncbi:MAG: VWA domain-containing protein [Alphaproteobacteria bacterium]|nr:MAG: VWA domain-containing protein [Alphaproteobacteria bacterium]
MPNFINLLILSVLLFSPLPAWAEISPDIVGGRIEAIADGRPVNFPLLKTDIVANVKGDLASVTVKQTFSNPMDKPRHATYLFPLNHDAAVNKMVMEVGDERVEAKIQRIEQAKQTFETAKHEGKAAALLVQHRPNMFTQDIANLMPGMPVQVTLTYVYAVPKVDGQYELVLPLVVGPRYQPIGAGAPPSPAAQVSAKEQFGQWEIENLPAYPPVAGLDIPNAIEKDRVSIEVHLDAGLPITAVSSKTHAIKEEKGSETSTVIRLADGRTIDNADFVLHYGLAGKLPQAGMLAHKDKRGGFFSLQLEPPAVPEAKDIAPREMVFVLDTSGSMSGMPVETCKIFMKHALNAMHPGDYFRIIHFSNNAEEYTSRPVAATQENIKRGLDYVNGLYADGGTEANKAIIQAFSMPPKEGTLRIVVFLTDGYIGNESEILQSIAQRLDNARIYALGVGTSVNRFLLEEMGRAGRGFARFIDPTEKGEDVAIQLASKLESPVLTDINIDWGNLKVAEQTPVIIPDLFAGGSIRIQGKYDDPGRHTITVKGRVNGRKAELPVTLDLPQASDEKDSPIPVILARTQIAEDMRLINMPPAFRPKGFSDDTLKDKVISLGLDFNLVTRWTSFVAVSTKIVNEHPELAENTNVPLPMVKGVTQKAYGSSMMQMASFSGGSVPEPSTIAGLAVISALGLFALWRRRQRRDFQALLYVIAANAWLAACSTEGDSHAG